MLPASTGANPSATLLAGAEHAIEGLIRTITLADIPGTHDVRGQLHMFPRHAGQDENGGHDADGGRAV
ncbi:hypothetical protein [Brevibacterium marinum]|uniref:Uncharacterized protein n=1 Tax=Brevibacterium marinum TaxID=418643 RepID=A0A846RWK4_9MICO|nr:hypothetical protein [Brevibacterium marinum]NJC56346.1 hypothetical protein [Brevibacterium marinum]